MVYFYIACLILFSTGKKITAVFRKTWAIAFFFSFLHLALSVYMHVKSWEPRVSRGQYMSQHSYAKRAMIRDLKPVCACVREWGCVGGSVYREQTSGWGTRPRWSLGRCHHSSFTMFLWASLHTQVSWLPETVLRAEIWEMMRTKHWYPLSHNLHQTERQFPSENFIAAGVQPEPVSWNPLCLSN